MTPLEETLITELLSKDVELKDLPVGLLWGRGLLLFAVTARHNFSRWGV